MEIPSISAAVCFFAWRTLHFTLHTTPSSAKSQNSTLRALFAASSAHSATSTTRGSDDPIIASRHLFVADTPSMLAPRGRASTSSTLKRSNRVGAGKRASITAIPSRCPRDCGPAHVIRRARNSRKQSKPAAKALKQKGHWIFQQAKARLSEVVRLAQSEGPQHVTVHGRAAVVVVAEEEFRRLKGEVTGAALVAAMQASPSREVDLEPKRARMPVRNIDLS